MDSEGSWVGARGRHSTMKRRALAVCVGLLLLGSLPGLAEATAPVLDAWHGASGSIVVQANDFYAQTFKALHTGTLTEVDLYVSCTSTTQIVTTIYRTMGNPAMPDTADPLSSGGHAYYKGAAAWVATHPTYSVTAGNVYAITFPTGPACSAYVTGNTYGDGEALEGDGEGVWATYKPAGDFAFRTYVVPAVAATPTPTPAPTPTPTPAATPAPAAKSTPTPAPTASSSFVEPPASESPSATASPVSTASSVGSATAASASSTASETPGALAANSTTSGGSGSGGSALPIVAAILVVLALAGGGLWFMLMRRQKTGDSPPAAPTVDDSPPTASAPTATIEAASLAADSPTADPHDSIPPIGD